MYQIIGDKTYIDGSKGYYDNKIKNPSVRYARNSVNNYKNYLRAFDYVIIEISDSDKLEGQPETDTFELSSKSKKRSVEVIEQLIDKNVPPSRYEQRYTPYATDYRFLDKDALLGAAYEEMDELTTIPVKELTQRLQQVSDESWGEGEILMDASVLDLDGNGEIDLGEFSASIILEDALSKDDSHFDERNVDGSITEQGEEKELEYFEKDNYALARTVFKRIYKLFNLARAQENFLSDENNIVA